MTTANGYSCLSFLTDYGRADGFVAICHGQMAKRAPTARVIDITHDIGPGDVRRGAAVLAETVPELPPAVHVAVVDPGVGTRRRSIAVAAGGHVLVGPDNGVLMWAADALGGAEACHELTEPGLWRHPVSATFHGRDIYAPVGASVAAGTPLSEVGPELADPVRLPAPRREVSGTAAGGEVRAVDRFGNCQLSVFASDLSRTVPGGTPERVEVRAHGNRWTVPVADTFASVAHRQPLLLTDSAGYLALAQNGGDAAHGFGLRAGDPVDLVPVSEIPANPV
ncbi:hypothetical protein FHX37_4354 [Haloactinospora alba]|uniref:SAM-dependent chlorinase/fluorinase n=1 Tax=Haloactinospora alba TaxID=405555 RepID=A0A543N744_9ACTN|nr:SAM-dependent chlorinase/fluorinase [Haloactinospora alba]TQN27630.1 hypothetical protein FHX37_4354 [Haloactinospora alba]